MASRKQSRLSFSLALVLFSMLSSNAHAVAIDLENGCKQGAAKELAVKLCKDFDSQPGFDGDRLIKAAQSRCLKFYEKALNTQNIFCSYRIDSVVFEVFSEVNREAALRTPARPDILSNLGKSNVSQQAVTQDNRRVASINQAYMDEIAVIAPKLRTAYRDYIAAIGRLNGVAMSDIAHEALCHPEQAQSTVPAYLRELLALASHTTAKITFDSMWTAVRENHLKLKQVKNAAEENARIAEMRNLEAGTIFQESVKKEPEKNDDIILPPESEANNPVVSYAVNRGLTMVPKVAARASIVACGAVIAYQWNTGQTINASTAVLCLAGYLNPELALAIGVLKSRYDRAQIVVEKYRTYSQEELNRNVNQTSLELASEWARRTKQPQCAERAVAEAECIERRKTMQPYEHNSCSRSPLDRVNPAPIRGER